MKLALCKECHIHPHVEGSSLCTFCKEKYCIACEVLERRQDSKFCQKCKMPDRIIVICTHCGNRFWLKPDEEGAKKLFEFDGISHLTPQNGMTIKMSSCNICYKSAKEKVTKITVL